MHNFDIFIIFTIITVPFVANPLPSLTFQV